MIVDRSSLSLTVKADSTILLKDSQNKKQSLVQKITDCLQHLFIKPSPLESIKNIGSISPKLKLSSKEKQGVSSSPERMKLTPTPPLTVRARISNRWLQSVELEKLEKNKARGNPGLTRVVEATASKTGNSVSKLREIFTKTKTDTSPKSPTSIDKHAQVEQSKKRKRLEQLWEIKSDIHRRVSFLGDTIFQRDKEHRTKNQGYSSPSSSNHSGREDALRPLLDTTSDVERTVEDQRNKRYRQMLNHIDLFLDKLFNQISQLPLEFSQSLKDNITKKCDAFAESLNIQEHANMEILTSFLQEMKASLKESSKFYEQFSVDIEDLSQELGQGLDHSVEQQQLVPAASMSLVSVMATSCNTYVSQAINESISHLQKDSLPKEHLDSSLDKLNELYVRNGDTLLNHPLEETDAKTVQLFRQRSGHIRKESSDNFDASMVMITSDIKQEEEDLEAHVTTLRQTCTILSNAVSPKVF